MPRPRHSKRSRASRSRPKRRSRASRSRRASKKRYRGNSISTKLQKLEIEASKIRGLRGDRKILTSPYTSRQIDCFIPSTTESLPGDQGPRTAGKKPIADIYDILKDERDKKGEDGLMKSNRFVAMQEHHSAPDRLYVILFYHLDLDNKQGIEGIFKKEQLEQLKEDIRKTVTQFSKNPLVGSVRGEISDEATRNCENVEQKFCDKFKRQKKLNSSTKVEQNVVESVVEEEYQTVLKNFVSSLPTLKTSKVSATMSNDWRSFKKAVGSLRLFK